MDEFSSTLQTATAAVHRRYFQLEVYGSDPTYRERVYCYELYHQLRLSWPVYSSLVLNGEVDKSGHPAFAATPVAGKKPDFLIHQPGSMDANYAAIEVKSPTASTVAIREDIAKLFAFLGAGYHRALYLLYGYEAQDVASRACSEAEKLPSSQRPEIWIHSADGAPAMRIES